MSDLPPCRWRREPTAADRVMCMSPKMVVGPAGVHHSTCLTCPYLDHDSPPRGRGQCVHLGSRTGHVPCAPCTVQAGHRIELPVHACAVHGSCTIARTVPGRACCASCSQHVSAWRRVEAGAIRHLTYHICPKGDIWRWNAAHLRERLSLFNGRRIISVCVDGYTDRLEDVQEALGGPGVAEWIHLANDVHRREMVSHPTLLERMSDLVGEQDVTWYGHGKGIGSSLVADGVRRWTEEMYRGTLDYWPEVRRQLADHAAVGILMRRSRHPPGVPVVWHYGGTFRWTRNADLYRRDWRRIDPSWMGPETYPGLHIRYEEAACLWGEHASGGWGYGLAEWDQGWRGPASEAWHAAHVADRHTPLLMTVIVRCHQHPDRVHECIESVRSQVSSEWELLLLSSGRPEIAGLAARYAADARIRVVVDPEGPPAPGDRSRAARRVNEAVAGGLVRGDLILCVPDDDLLYPQTIGTLVERARVQAGESAWYGRLDVQRIHPGGRVEPLPGIGTCGILDGRNCGRGQIDGMQVCVRRGAWVPYPEEASAERMCDGWWMDAVGASASIVPLDLVVGVQRHTPTSYYTR